MYGSVINRILENSESPKPEVGMGVTRTMWSDRKAYTVIKVCTPRKIVVQEDHAKRTDKNGMSESQTYEYSPNPEGTEITLTLRTNGQWRAVGSSKKSGDGWVLGVRRAYHDPSF